MHQDATWNGGRPQPRGLCVCRLTHSLPKKGGVAPQFSAHVYCGQTAEWIKMPLGTEVVLAQTTLCYMGTQLPSQKTGRNPVPNFRPMSIVVKRLDGSRWDLA